MRQLVHSNCPEVEEKIKWGSPHFNYQGMMCSITAFKQHCAFGFRKAKFMKDPKGLFDNESSMGYLGRISNLKDLPTDKVLIAYIEWISEAKTEATRKSG